MKWVKAYDLLPGDVLEDGKEVGEVTRRNPSMTLGGPIRYNPYAFYAIDEVVFTDGTRHGAGMEYPLKYRRVKVLALREGDLTSYGTVLEVSGVRYPGEVHVKTRSTSGFVQHWKLPVSVKLEVTY